MPTTATPSSGLTGLDHLVIGLYLAAMLGMGLRIARRQKSTDDFFVGGRNLPAWAVGISLIASLLSTITYLGMPGEMFRTGIGFLTRQLGIPLVLLVVWFLWIPFFMRLNLTSAYEYLERRFNYATRALAALFCMLLLFGWISVVVLTASKAMAEIAQLDLDWFFGRNISATQTLADGSARIGPEDLVGNPAILAAQIVRQGAATDASPGRRIWQLLDESTRQNWPADPARDLSIRGLGETGRLEASPTLRTDGFDADEAVRLSEAEAQRLADALTAVLPRRELYAEEEWRAVKLSDEARAYLKAGVAKLSEREVTHLNRSLVVSAFPAHVAASRPEFRDADMHALILSIGLFSILYTTLGGIRAVIWTDVAQFFILIGGALFTMGAIAWSTNSGLGDWLETSANYRHEQVEWFSWDVGNRSTVFAISIGMFFWHMCTHGSNQVALQRYFAVKDVAAARRSFLVNAIASIGLGIILAGVGIALMHFIQHQTMPAAADIDSAVTSIRNEAQDKIFPQYIRLFLPAGLKGMVVAALFAAAMSTIDSGANSVSTIVTVDFFRRLSRNGTSTAGELRLARVLTASMGIIVVASTVFLYHLSKGTDLITLCQKGFNCFLGPLGALFVLAMFCRWATPASVIPALIVGELVGIGTSYSSELFGVAFSTHLVIPAAWLATIVAAYKFALVLRTEATAEQRQWMWLPVVRSRELERSPFPAEQPSESES